MNATNVAHSLIALLFLMLLVFLYNSITVTPNTEVKPRIEAVYDKPFLALQRLLEAENINVEVIEGYEETKFNPAFFDNLSIEDAVAFRLAELPIDKLLANSILQWVSRGGFLVVSGLVYQDVSEIPANQLLQKLGVRLETPDEASHATTDMGIEFRSISLNLDTDSHFADSVIDEEQDFWAGTKTGTTLIQKPLGDGYVTLMTDIDIWTNEQIQEYDHGYFAHFLFSGKNNLYIFGTADKPHWIISLTRLSPGLVFFIALFVVLGLWFSAIRFGSVQKINQSNPSAFKLHLEASAIFYWKADKHHTFLNNLRTRIRQDIVSKYSLRDAKRIEKILPQLAEKTKLSPEIIQQSLENWQPSSEGDYIELVKRLQRLRKHL